MTIEERIELLESKLEAVTLEAERAKAAVEIQSIMGRYEFYYMAQRQDLMGDLWSKRADASMDIMGGAKLVNQPLRPEEIEAEPQAESHATGTFRVHALSTPVVEVAADCMTARACWISPGFDTDVRDGKTNSAAGAGSNMAVTCPGEWYLETVASDFLWYHTYRLLSELGRQRTLTANS